MHEDDLRAALRRHWAASDANERRSTKSTEMTRCSSTLNRASASVVGTTFRRRASRSRARSVSCDDVQIAPLGGQADRPVFCVGALRITRSELSVCAFAGAVVPTDRLS